MKNFLKNPVNENPFYGMSKTLTMFQQVPKMTNDTVNQYSINTILDNAWNECKNSLEKRQLFFTLFIKHLDISNREHNVFIDKFGKGIVENGGDGIRKVGFYQLKWLLSKDKSMRKQFYALLPYIVEYSNNENAFFFRNKTDRFKGNLIEKMSIIPESSKVEFIEEISSYFAEKINSLSKDSFEHVLISKFLPKPRFAKRKREYTVTSQKVKALNKKMSADYKIGDVVVRRADQQQFTDEKEFFEADFIHALSKKLDWDVIKYPKNHKFVGLIEYKAKYNRLSEAYLFSSKEILKYDQEQFIKWLDKLPAGARYRVQRRLFNKDGEQLISTKKWVNDYGDLAYFYNEWLNRKEAANNVVRQLSNKDKNELTETDKKVLAQAKKEAKVNIAGESLIDVVAKFFNGGNEQELNVIADNILSKIVLNVPCFVSVDRSGSMTSRGVSSNGVSFSARDLAKLALTIFLLKNPEPDLANIFALFSSEAEIITDNNFSVTNKKNRYTIGNTKEVTEPIINREVNFLTNFKRVSQIVDSYQLATSTSLSCIAETLKKWVDSDPSLKEGRKELICKFPVWLAISDGDLNNNGDATESCMDFKSKMLHWFGWDGLLVLWDVKDESRGSNESSKFENIPNTIYFGSYNANALTQVFSNLSDIDIVDIYTPLQTIFRSNRYELIKGAIL
jgi:hypothetical protein